MQERDEDVLEGVERARRMCGPAPGSMGSWAQNVTKGRYLPLCALKILDRNRIENIQEAWSDSPGMG